MTKKKKKMRTGRLASALNADDKSKSGRGP